MNYDDRQAEETCGCGASIRLHARHLDQIEENLAVWRENHRHDLPADTVAELQSLRRWKAEAMECLDDWHAAYDRIVPRDFGLLGEKKPDVLVRYVQGIDK